MIHWHYLAWFGAACCFLLALLGWFGAGMASRQVTREDLQFPRMCALVGAILIVLTLAACGHTESGIEVRTVTKTIEVARPCPGIVPERPEPLGPLVPGAANALAQVLAKLAEWSAPGKFGDQAMAYVAACPPSE